MSIFTVVLATFVYRVTLYTSERAVSEYQCLVESHLAKREYQHLSCVVNIQVPVRYPFDKFSMNGGLMSNNRHKD
jgi:hypothetical protein